MSRLDRATERVLFDRLAYLRRTVDDMKQLQTFGSSNFAVNWLHRKTADITVQVPANSTICIEVTLTPNSAVSNPAIALAFEVVSLSPGGAYAVTPFLSDGGVQRWHVWVTNPLSTYVSRDFRFAFQSISLATWEAH